MINDYRLQIAGINSREIQNQSDFGFALFFLKS
jgi:hypothetical protein